MTTILMAMVLLTDPDTYMEWIAAEEIAHKSKIMIAYNYICDFMKYNKITNKPFLRFEDWAEVSHVTGFCPLNFSKTQLWHQYAENYMSP